MITDDSTTDPVPAPDWARPNDPGGHLAHALMLVATGRRHRAPGIRHCTDCVEPFIDDHTGLTCCPTCRTGHRRRCVDCQRLFANTVAGHRRCPCCRDQLPLFDAGGAP